MSRTLELYTMTGCPFCNKVINFINQRNIKDVKIIYIEEPNARERLLNEGGKVQVPCLFIDGKAMYESGDIIAFLDKEYA